MSSKISLTRYLVEQQRSEGHIPSHLRLLADEGRQLCVEGQSRSGISKLRRALKEAQRGE